MSLQFTRTILLYALLLAGAAFALQWLEFNYFLKRFPTAGYVAVLAIMFVTLGIWLGYRLAKRGTARGFERNIAALNSLGISNRELEVLEAIAAGQSNKEIARALKVTPNTIKTHVAHLFEKLEVDRRVLAIEKARLLQLIAS